MAEDKLTIEITAKFIISKSSVSDWTKKYSEERQYSNTTSSFEDNLVQSCFNFYPLTYSLIEVTIPFSKYMYLYPE